MNRLELTRLILEVLNEENILIPRRLEGRRELYVKKLKAMLQQKHIDGDLNLSGVPEITDLGNVETISGFLELNDSKVTSLGNLTSVGGDLSLYNSKVASLGNLTSVGGELFLYNSNVTSLGNLKKVGGSIHIKDGQFSEELLDKYKKLFSGKIIIWKNNRYEILK